MIGLLVTVKALLGKGLSQEEVAASVGVTPEWVRMVQLADAWSLVGAPSGVGDSGTAG